MPKCSLCHNERELRNSHIVPEFLYRDLYNDDNQMVGIHGRGHLGRKLLQKGIRERLFCEQCEQHFNEHFEKPFRSQWIEAAPMPRQWSTDDVCFITVDYASFKLFHLSVLFRAGVSSLPTFEAVSLGPHAERLRAMLLTCSPGAPAEYPIVGYAVIHNKTKCLVPMVSQAQRSIIGGQRYYGMMYGGVEWWVRVSSHADPKFDRLALQQDGRMPIKAMPWNEFPVIQAAANALRGERP